MATSDGCIFCRIAAGAVPAHEVWRDEDILAFLDIAPIREGHVQIIPLAHHDSFDVLPEDTAQAILRLGQRIARVQKRLLGVPRVGFMFTGGDVAHAHAHLVPMWEKTDITSPAYIAETPLTFRPAAQKPAAELAEMAARLSEALKAAAQPA